MEEALGRLGAGEPVVLTSAIGANLVVAASFVRASDVALMAREGRGLVRVVLPPERCDRLGLARLGRGPVCTSREDWQVTVEARTGVTTGISAADRAHTVRTLVDGSADPDAIVSPGHVVPIRAAAGGVLARCAPAEAALDLCGLAGAGAGAALCHVLDDRGDVAGGLEPQRLALRLGLVMVDVEEVWWHLAGGALLPEGRRGLP
jgi:3,4-dihydroxy-2-butanone 4-phosphate synthase